MLILDGYCGAGAAADGYVEAGFDVVGVDLNPQPNYPYPFIQADFLSLDPRFLRMFDAIHASPPCQHDTVMRHAKGAKGDANPDLIPPTLAKLRALDIPWVVENVDSPSTRLKMPGATMLCGSMFDLGVEANCWHQLQRHRLFLTSFPLPALGCDHIAEQPVIGIYGGHVRCRSAKHGGRRTRDFEGFNKKSLALQALGIRRDMTWDEISETIPPAYTAHIGRALMRRLRYAAAA